MRVNYLNLRHGALVLCCLVLALTALTASASAAKGDVDLVSRASGIAGPRATTNP